MKSKIITIAFLLCIILYPPGLHAEVEINPNGIGSGAHASGGGSVSMFAALETGGTSSSGNGRVVIHSGFIGQLSTGGSNTAPIVDPNIDVHVTGYQADLTAIFTDPDASDTHTASIDWGDGFTYPGVVTPGTGGGTVTGSHLYAGDGIFTITVTVEDTPKETGSADVTICIFSYLVNSDGTGGGVNKYWPGTLGYFDAWWTATDYIGGDSSNPAYPFYPAWCAYLDTLIKLGVWYNNVGMYSSLTDTCSLVDNPENLDLVNYLLFKYRLGTYIPYGASQREIQAVIWRLLFNSSFDWGNTNNVPGGGITWDIGIADQVYTNVLGGSLPPYDSNDTLPIVVIIDCGDQVNLIEIPYWLYLELLDLGIIGACP